MGLAGKQQLYRAVWIIEDTLQPLLVSEDQGAALVGGKAAGKPDGQHIRLQHILQAQPLQGADLIAQHLGLEALPEVVEQFLFDLPLGGPERLVRDSVHALPEHLFVEMIDPVFAEVLVVELAHLVDGPGEGMHPVGDMGDGDLVGGDGRPHITPELARHFPVQLADPVAEFRQLQGKDGQVEDLVSFRLHLGTQFHKLVAADADRLPVALEEFIHQVQGEGIVAGRHRGVGGENRVGGDCLQRFGILQVLMFDQVADPFQRQEDRMAFIHVPGHRFDAQLLQHQHPAHAQQNFLGDAHLLIAAVEAGRKHARFRGVFRHVGIQQVGGNTSHLGDPNPQGDIAVADRHDHRQGLALGIQDLTERQLFRVVGNVERDLIAVGIDLLGEVGLVIEEAHPHHRQAEVAGRFDMISRQHPQPPGIDRKRFVKTELGREISDDLFFIFWEGSCKPGAFRRHVAVKRLHDVAIRREVNRIFAAAHQLTLLCFPEKFYRVVI